MAEVLGTTAGVVSLGIQLCDKITQYIEDFNTRDEQLLSVLGRAQHLKESLNLLDQLAQSFAPAHAEASQIVSANIATCKRELEALKDFAHELVPSLPPDNKMGKMRETTKRLAFPFKSADVKKLDAHLEKSLHALSRATDCLQLCSQLNIVSGQSAILSRLIRMESIVEEMHSYRVQPTGTISTQQQRAEVVTMELMKKPSLLQEACDAVVDVTSPSQSIIPGVLANQQDGSVVMPNHGIRRCPECGFRPRRYEYSRMSPSIFSISILEETVEERAHRPCCKRSQRSTGQTSRRSFALRSTVLRAYLSTAVSIGFFTSYEAGRYSVGPVLNCQRTVYSRESPAFVLIDRIMTAIAICRSDPKTAMQVVDHGVSTLRQIFGAKQALPTDIDEHGATLTTTFCCKMYIYSYFDDLFWQVVGMLMDLEIPTQGTGTHETAGPALHHCLLGINSINWSAMGIENQLGAKVVRLSSYSENNFISSFDVSGRHPLSVCSPLSIPHEGIAEVYGVGSALAEALLQRSEEQLQKSLAQARERDEILSLDEGGKNCLLDLAISWPRGLQLILASRSATNISKYLDDGSAVKKALQETSLIFHGEIPWDRLCDDNCVCSESLRLLLECRSHVDLSLMPWRPLSTLRAVRVLISHIQVSRDKLAELARSELPPDEQAGLGLDGKSVLDHHANQVVALLESRGTCPYQRLGWTRGDARVQCCHSGGSIYHWLRSEDAASFAFDLGFKDVDCIDGDGLTPLASAVATHSYLPYLRWLLDNGASVARMFLYAPADKGQLVPSHTIAHWLMSRVALKLRYGLRHRNQDIVHISKILEQVFGQATIKDDCDCACTGTDGGCSPLLVLLNQYVQKLKRNDEFLSQAERLKLMEEELSDAGIVKELMCKPLIRLLAFEGLGLRHTCCMKFFYEQPQYVDTSCSDDFDEIREEDGPLYAELEQLVAELTTQFEQSDLDIFAFLNEALQRIQDVADEINCANLTQEEKNSIEAAGVRFVYGPAEFEEEEEAEEDVEEEEKQRRILAFWINEFDRIAKGDFSEPDGHIFIRYL